MNWRAAELSQCYDDDFGFQACKGACFSCASARDTCVDDDLWHKKGQTSKVCDWVARDLPTRCAVKGESEEWAFEACPDSCGVCSS